MTGSFNFGQQLVLNIAGPIATAITGGLLVGVLAGMITRAAQQRKAFRQLRENLITDVTETSASLYIATQQFWRATVVLTLTDDELKDERNAFEAVYAQCRVKGTVLENRLAAYYSRDIPRFLCHRMMDLLTVRYFQLAFPDHVPYRENAGTDHTGLGHKELKNPKLLLNQYRSVQRELCDALLREPLDSHA